MSTTATSVSPYQVILLGVTLSHPKLFEPKSYKGEGKPRFGANFILFEGKHDKALKEINSKIAALLAEKKKKIRPENWCIRPADEDEWGKGAWEVRAYSQETRPPQVLRRDKTVAVPKDDLFYGGAIVDGIFHIYEAMDKVNAGLDCVRFVEHGDRKGRKPVDGAAVLPDLDESGDGLD